MARKLVSLPSVSRVVAGAKATVEIPLGPTYHRIIFEASGTLLAIANFGQISVYIDGKLVQQYANLQRLIDLNSYYNRGVDSAANFALHFFRAELMDVVYRRAPAIGTADVQTFHVEIDIDAAAPADITLKATAEIDPMPQPLGVMFKVREYPFSSAVAGQIEIDKLPRGAFYSAIHLFKADVNSAVLLSDQVKVMDASKAALERAQKEASPVKRVPLSAKATSLDFITEGDLAQSIDTSRVQDFRVQATLGTSGTMDVVTETLDTLKGA